MNKSQIALEISQDIYAIGGDLEKATHQLHNFEISSTQYANSLYVMACEAIYLKQVIQVMRESGYQFRNYEKELTILNTVTNTIDDNFKLSNMNELSVEELKPFLDLTKKYEEIVPVDDLEDELEY